MLKRKGTKTNNVKKINTTYVKQQEQHLERKQREKKLLIRRLVAFGVLFTIIVGTLSLYFFQQQTIHSEKESEYEQLQSELQAQLEEQEELEREVELLNDVDYLLQIARKDYFFSKEGEIIFTLPEEEEEPSY
ncbi:septum formation initiator family protein [Alkalibacillus haloalkaliphilus]|uniref:septum formation initiator family protein n=1 Tax=Alkalibacillus haloalkaliphilus TaxID=94136 RepID=UPI0029369029|nr:septum formation initiator family protein [Alkalibacillus haloalkaliphilus]MDV2583240.1 septum formation initiator family protein [Alkalibacillus haloalkaliphilus]